MAVRPIDEQAMLAAIERHLPKTYLFEIAEAKRVVCNALDHFFEVDAEHLAITGVECAVELLVPGVPRVHGYIDLRAVADSGERLVIDWKTTGGELDAKWLNRQTDSWQWRIYAYGTGATHVVYRGLSRNGSIRSIIIEVPPDNNEAVERYLQQCHAMREAVRACGTYPWPQSKPGACNAYGRPCQYLDHCRGNEPLPIGNGSVSHSYSSLQTFSLCPERARLDAALGAESSENESTSFGSIVHAGLAAAYSSAFAETIVFPAASR